MKSGEPVFTVNEKMELSEDAENAIKWIKSMPSKRYLLEAVVLACAGNGNVLTADSLVGLTDFFCGSVWNPIDKVRMTLDKNIRFIKMKNNKPVFTEDGENL